MEKIACPECGKPLTYIERSVEFKCLHEGCSIVRITYTWDLVKILLRGG